MTGLRQRSWSGTGRRLFVAFAVLIGGFGAASGLALSGMAEMQAGLRAMRDREEAVRLALQLASAVRDQYAHQAHTIILGNASHLGFYEESHRTVLALAARVEQRTESDEERAEVAEIRRASLVLDTLFNQQIVPAVLAQDAETVNREHGRGLAIVSDIQGSVDRLVTRFERSIGEAEARAQAVQRRTFAITLGFLLGALALAAAVGVYIGRSVAVPIRRLREGAAAVGRGDLEARIDLASPDEFGDLARQFNAMTGALKENQERLVQSEKLAGIGRLAAGVAHEINNPLGVILGYAKLLRKKAEGEAAADLQVIEDETHRCQEIVEGLLDLSRPMKGEPGPVDLRALCEDVIERLAETPAGTGVRISLVGEATAQGVEKKVRQVIFNLLKNAAEASGSAGAVEVRLSQQAGQALASIKDSGPGLAPEARLRLFEPFFTTKPQGTGLGLAVSQAIARAHGGGIDVEQVEGGGAVFTLKLPAAPV